MSKPRTAEVEEERPARGALAALALAMVLSALGTSIANVGLPTLAEAFHAPFQRVQWVVIAYLLTITSVIVGAGRLGDLLGRRRLLLAGIALFTAASVLCALAPSLTVLIAARAAQGLGAAVMMALALALVTEAVPRARTGRALGVLGAMSAVGTALGPPLGGALIAVFGWRAMFLVTVPLGMVALAWAARGLPADQPARDGRGGFDVPGTLLLALTLSAYALAMTIGRGRFGPVNRALLLATAVGTGLFLRTEGRTASPLVPVGLLRDPVLMAALAMSALVMTVMMATLVVGPFYLSRALQLDAAAVGLVMSAGPVVTALTSAPAGRGVDRFGERRMILLGLAGIAAGALLLAVFPRGAGIPGYVTPIVLITSGYALFQAANNTAVLRHGRPEQRGVLSGLLNLSRNLGLITGASAMGAVFARAAGTAGVAAAPPEAVAAGMRTTFGVAALLVVAALALAVGGGARGERPHASWRGEAIRWGGRARWGIVAALLGAAALALPL